MFENCFIKLHHNIELCSFLILYIKKVERASDHPLFLYYIIAYIIAVP